MIKIFTALIFISELFLVMFLLYKIIKLDFVVTKFNSEIMAKRLDVIVLLRKFRTDISELLVQIGELMLVLRAKQQDYIISLAKNVLPYALMLFLRGKYRKSFLMLKVTSDIYEGFKESWDW